MENISVRDIDPEVESKLQTLLLKISGEIEDVMNLLRSGLLKKGAIQDTYDLYRKYEGSFYRITKAIYCDICFRERSDLYWIAKVQTKCGHIYHYQCFRKAILNNCLLCTECDKDYYIPPHNNGNSWIVYDGTEMFEFVKKYKDGVVYLDVKYLRKPIRDEDELKRRIEGNSDLRETVNELIRENWKIKVDFEKISRKKEST